MRWNNLRNWILIALLGAIALLATACVPGTTKIHINPVDVIIDVPGSPMTTTIVSAVPPSGTVTIIIAPTPTTITSTTAGVTTTKTTTAPTTTITTGINPIGVGTLSTARFLEILQISRSENPDNLDARISKAIDLLNTEFEKDQSRGYRGKTGTVIDNPGPAGVTVVWTDTKDSSEFIPELIDPSAPGGLEKNWIPLDGFAARANSGQSMTNGWGLWKVFTAVRMKTTFTAIRLSDPLP